MVQNSGIPELESGSASPSLQAFLSLCVRLDPGDRPTCKVLMQHEFITQNVAKYDAKRFVKKINRHKSDECSIL
jgi:serine/threonine protein kinase